jgi:hypothetical protein
MKTFIRNISIITVVSGVLLTSCKKDFLNTTPLNQPSSSTTWADPNLATAYVTELYNGLHEGELNQESTDCLTDNAIYSFWKMDMMEANVSPSNLNWVDNTYEWGEMYARIRSANISLEKLATAPFDKTLADRLKGEAYFMRAYFYNQLLRYYGGVPLVKSSYSASATDFSIARSSYSDCVDFIVSDLTTAATLLQGKAIEKGRATSDAAMALKARVLLYAASDLHDIPTASANSATIKAFAHPELLGYVSGDRKARWQAAQTAALAVINLGTYGYMLNLSAPAATAAEGSLNYQNACLSRNGGEAEVLFARYYSNSNTNSNNEWGAWYARNNCTNGYHGWTSSEPTQNMVDDYEMMDGSKFDWNNPAEAAAPYTNRDPRFYASILYDGAPWKPRTPDGAGIDPFNEIQMGTYQTGSSASPVTYHGLDTRQGPIENWNGTWTGYAIRKFIDPNPAIVDMNTRQEVPSPLIRYTEVVYNYVEACIELGDEVDARLWLNRVRFRSGMPAITDVGDALKQRYRNERNVELMFEDQRFYDARRWMIAPTTLGNKAMTIQITGTLKPGKSVSVYRYSTDNFNYTYTTSEFVNEHRKWDDKLYFPPISRDEVNKNLKLVQNPGY